jgi:hypothetical protein
MGEMEISPIAHVIQLSVAPVFLLSGIGAILAVMTSRLGRIIDRARTLEAQLDNAPAERVATLCTATALLVCTVIANGCIKEDVDGKRRRKNEERWCRQRF